MKNIPLKATTGINGFDSIIGGGLPSKRLYLLQGEPGTGKTTFALNFLLEGVRLKETCLYITFSETKDELQVVAKSHNWDLSGVSLMELSAIEEQLKAGSQNTIFHPAEIEMNKTIELIKEEFIRVKPQRLVFDSVSEMRMLADTSLRYRRQMLELKQYFTDKDCTVLLLDDLTATSDDLQLQSIVHGVINLEKMRPEFGDERRRLSIIKLRGIQFSGGYHDYKILPGGIQVYPRMLASDHVSIFAKKQASSGLPSLDKLLAGGLEYGTSNLFMGPAGTGKSTLALQFARAAVERGEKTAIFAFEESLNTLLNRTEAIGMNLKKHMESGMLEILRIDPSQLTPGEFSDHVRKSVLNNGIKMVVIDSLNGYMHAMPQERYLILQLHELLTFLGNQGIVTIMILAQQGMLGSGMSSPVDLTYLADTVLITRYFEALGSVKKAVSVLKKRGGDHERTIREFQIGPKGIIVGEALTKFQGVLSGIPTFHGQESHILNEASDNE